MNSLEQENNFLKSCIKVYMEEIERLHSVIKEVREYIVQPQHEMSVKTYQELLEILDKDSDK